MLFQTLSRQKPHKKRRGREKEREDEREGKCGNKAFLLEIKLLSFFTEGRNGCGAILLLLLYLCKFNAPGSPQHLEIDT